MEVTGPLGVQSEDQTLGTACHKTECVSIRVMAAAKNLKGGMHGPGQEVTLVILPVFHWSDSVTCACPAARDSGKTHEYVGPRVSLCHRM